jgi:hypothetical protein
VPVADAATWPGEHRGSPGRALARGGGGGHTEEVARPVVAERRRRDLLLGGEALRRLATSSYDIKEEGEQ